MNIEPTQKVPKPGDIIANRVNSESWFIGHGEYQDFTLRVTATSPAEKGKYVGLIQTLLTSERLATYTPPQGDTRSFTFQVLPNEGPPTLDSTDELRPWFSGKSEAKQLSVIGQAVELKIEDKPSITLPQRLKQNNVKVKIARYHVKESFLISLVVFDETDKGTLYAMKDDLVKKQERSDASNWKAHEISLDISATPEAKQAAASKAAADKAAADQAYVPATDKWNNLTRKTWVWSYEYAVVPGPDDKPKVVDGSVVVGPANEEAVGTHRLVAHRDTATAPPHRFIIAPDGWKPDYD